jgi:hypothetical protein
MTSTGLPQGQNSLVVRPKHDQNKTADDPLAEAEAALKKLRQDAGDKQAADALEQALKQLKERTKPEGQTGSPEKKP